LVGDSGQLTVALRDAAGSRVFRRPISWSSGNPTVATVDLTGMVKAVGAGKTGITASAGGASGTGKVGVELGGIFRITSLTGGTDLDPTGYVLAAGGVARRVGVNTTGDLPQLVARRVADRVQLCGQWRRVRHLHRQSRWHRAGASDE